MTSRQQKPASEQGKPAAPTSSPWLAPEQKPGDDRPSNDNPGPQQQK